MAVTLPIRPLPAPDETLASYVDRVAADRDVPVTTLLTAIGLARGDSPRTIISNYGLMLPPQAVNRAAHALRLDEAEVRTMLLDSYDGVAFSVPQDSSAPYALAVFAGREWVMLRGTNACPSCLAQDGAWQLGWRLPFIFACTDHRLLLADMCPGCEQRLGSVRSKSSVPVFVRAVPTPGRCMNPVEREDGGYGSVPCGYDLTTVKTASLSRAPRLLDAQARILSVLRGEPQPVGGELLDAQQYLHDIRLLCGLMLHVATVGDLGRLPQQVREAFTRHEEEREHDARVASGNRHRRFVRATPRSPALMAAVIPQAVEMLSGSTRSEVADSVIWLITRSRAIKGRAFARVPTAVENSETLRPLWEEALRSLDFDNRLRLRRNEDRAKARSLVRYVPQLLWPDIFERQFAALTPPATARLIMRRFCSVELVRLLSGISRRETAAALDLPASAAATASGLAHELRSLGRDGLFAVRLQTLADEFLASETWIDYSARRRALAKLEAIPWPDWSAICAEVGAVVGEPGGRHRYAAVWLWEELSLSDYRQAAGLSGRPLHQRYSYKNKFVRLQLPPVERPLRRYGERLIESAATIH